MLIPLQTEIPFSKPGIFLSVWEPIQEAWEYVNGVETKGWKCDFCESDAHAFIQFRRKYSSYIKRISTCELHYDRQKLMLGLEGYAFHYRIL